MELEAWPRFFNTLQFGTRLIPVSLEKCCHTVGPATASGMIYTLCASYTFRLPGRYWEEKGFVLPSPFPATLYPRCFILIEVTCCGEIRRVTFGQPRVAVHALQNLWVLVKNTCTQTKGTGMVCGLWFGSGGCVCVCVCAH